MEYVIFAFGVAALVAIAVDEAQARTRRCRCGAVKKPHERMCAGCF